MTRVTYPPDPANSGYTPQHPSDQPFQLGQMAPPRRGLSVGAILGICTAFTAVLCVAAAVAFTLIPAPDPDPPAAGLGTPAPYDALPGQQAPTSATPTPPATSAAPAGPKTSFGDGTWEIGTAAGLVAPGKYRTTVPQDSFNCYWERLKGTSGSFDDIIANDNVSPGTPTVVTIGATDAAFKSRGCGTWTKA